MARITPFSAGQKYYVDRGLEISYLKPNFWFVILGPSDKANEKRGEVLPDFALFEGMSSSVMEYLQGQHKVSTYSHVDLRKRGVLVDQSSEDLVKSQARAEGIMARFQPLLDAQQGFYAHPGNRNDVKKGYEIDRMMDAIVRGTPFNDQQTTLLNEILVERHAQEAEVLRAVIMGESMATLPRSSSSTPS